MIHGRQGTNAKAVYAKLTAGLMDKQCSHCLSNSRQTFIVHFSLNIPVSGARETSVATGAKRRRPVNVDYDEEEGEEEDEGIHSTSTSSLGSSMPRVTYRVATNSNGNIEFAPDQNEMGKCVKIVNSSDEARSDALSTKMLILWVYSFPLTGTSHAMVFSW